MGLGTLWIGPLTPGHRIKSIAVFFNYAIASGGADGAVSVLYSEGKSVG